MADLDRLLRPDISHAAADAAETPAFEPIERHGVRRRRTHTVLTAAAVVVLLLGVAGGLRFFDPDETSAPDMVGQPQRSLPIGTSSIEPGTYLVPSSIWSSVDFTITFPEGWRVREGNWFDTHGDQIDELGLSTFVVHKIYADACKGERGEQIDVGPGVDDLVEALLAQSGPAKTTVQTTFGGYPATRVDLHVPDRLQTKDCFIGPGTGVQIWLNGPDNYLYLAHDGLLSIYVVDVDGTRAVFQSQYTPTQSSAKDLAELQRVLDSIQIQR